MVAHSLCYRMSRSASTRLATHDLALPRVEFAILAARKSTLPHDGVALEHRRILARWNAASERFGHRTHVMRCAAATYANESRAELLRRHREIRHFIASEHEGIELHRKSMATAGTTQHHE